MKNKISLKDILNESKNTKLVSEYANEFKLVLLGIQDPKLIKLKLSLTNYFIIRLVSFLENTLRQLVLLAIDDLDFNIKDLIPNNEITISLLELEDIKKNKHVTVGRIIVQSYNFQNLYQIDSVFSKLFKTKFLSMVRKISKTARLSSYPEFSNKTFPFNWKEFSELFETRHDIVHRLKSKNDIEFEKLCKYQMYVIHFIAMTTYLIATTFFEKNQDKIKGHNPRLFEKFKEHLQRSGNLLK